MVHTDMVNWHLFHTSGKFYGNQLKMCDLCDSIRLHIGTSFVSKKALTISLMLWHKLRSVGTPV